MHERVPKRYVRDMQNPIDYYSDKEFKNRYRFSKTLVIECLMPLIFNEIEAVTTMRGLPVPQLIKLLAVLRFYGTGNIQLVSGDLVEISQPSISRCVKHISQVILKSFKKIIKFPSNPQEQRQNQLLFYNIAGNF
ncbi:putative nuclease HARBI1 [Metopolophium dirhodum]|uniref:putative nuclease HARBI1 n=1 Tax=Metopolophium dirhodum TaxID=44670 RepID=UPI0029904615|nr:putative nuclease HARBI1 [Metopolophium dirhodum]